MDQPPHGQPGRKRRPEDSGVSSRRLRAKRGCQVSRAARHEGAHDPDKQPHHHQKQRPRGGTAPVTGRCTRSGALHPIRRGALPTDRVQCPNTQEQTRNWQTESLLAHNQPEHRTQGGHRAGIEQLCCALDPHRARSPHGARDPHGARTYKTAPTSSHGDRGRGRGWLGRRARSAYSLTPPAVRPETMYFCRYWNSRMTGTAARTAPAAKMPHGAVRSSAAHMYMPTASVN